MRSLFALARSLLHVNSSATRRVERQLDKMLNMFERQWPGFKSIGADKIAHHCWAMHHFGVVLLSNSNYLSVDLATL